MTTQELHCDLAILGKYILPMDKKLSIINDGVVLVREGKVMVVDKQKSLKYKAKEIIDAKNSIVMPGLINTHTHAAMSYFRGLADDLSLGEWLENNIWPAERKNVNENFVQKATELACMEMIKSGTTCFNDMYFFTRKTLEVSEMCGIRAVASEPIVNFPSPSCGDTQKAFEKNKELVKDFKNEELIKISITPHSIYACSKDYLKRSAEFAKENGLILHIHISETKKEVDDCIKEHGMSPVAYLDKIGFLGKNVVSAHSIWLSDDDLDIFAKHNVKISHVPVSNMKLASGIMPITKMAEKDLLISLGTDGVASNNTLDLFEEIKICALLHKVSELEPTKISAREVITMATINGAKTLAWEDKIGSLETGKQADIITISLDKPHLQPIYDPCSHLAYAVNGADVENVVINGRIVMRDREIKTIDEERVLFDAKNFKLEK